jgi:hypothetical protein
VKGLAALVVAHKRRVEAEASAIPTEELITIVAADFVAGGPPSHARAFNRRGAELMALERDRDEPLGVFKTRAIRAADGPESAKLVIGGIGPPRELTAASEPLEPAIGLPRGTVTLKDASLHQSQREAVALINAERRVCLVCGRRWGKTTLVVALAVDYAISGRNVLVVAPTYKLMKLVFEDIALALGVVHQARINRADKDILLAGGGMIDFWSIDVTGRGGRGKGYHLVLVDEAAHDENDYLRNMLGMAIGPATLDFDGKIVLASTPRGLTNTFWECANAEEKGYKTFHAPTSANPRWSADSIAYLRSTMRPEEASQELDALFVDVAGTALFPLSLMLIDGEPYPNDGWMCDFVGVMIDSNSGKGGEGRDGCAALVFGLTADERIVLLDWDIVSLAQGGLASWLLSVRAMTMSWFEHLSPLNGLPRAWVEPAGNSPSIIEALETMDFHPNELDTRMMMWGKDGRALHAEPHFRGDMVKISRWALEKRISYRGVVANHLTKQVTGFRAFDKDANKREDDLFDAAMYAALVLGDGLETRWDALQ